MKQDGRLRNNLKQIRTRQGMSQADLAALAGVTRQTIGGLESDLYAPSAVVALKIARALGCRVEDLFWLEEDLPPIEAVAASPVAPLDGPSRLALVRIGERWVAHQLMGEHGFRTEMVPADGEGLFAPATGRVQVRLLDEPENLLQSVMLAGCSPALSLWARAAERWNPGIRVHWVFANSMAGLGALARDEVHAAGVHLYDAQSGEHNVPFVRRALPGRAVVLVNLGVWAEGLVVPPGNPKGLQRGADLAQAGVQIVNREPGAGSRVLLERILATDGVPASAVIGFDRVACGHLEVAREVAAGRADACVSTAAVAASYGLGFVPLQQVRYDMAVPKEHMELPAMRQLLSTLNHRRVRLQLEAIGGYDTSLTGEIVATVT